MADPSGCPQCGTVSGGARLRGLCPACLLGLGLGLPSETDLEPDGDPLVLGATYRVMTVLSSEQDRTTYLAEQGESRRLVTLDVVRIPVAGCDDALARCRERLLMLTRWVHPGVPRVVDGRRTPAGDFCVVAHYVKGPRLDQFCSTRNLDAGIRAGLFSRVCEIVSDGHRHAVCHGRLRADLIIVTGSRGDVAPRVLGYSVIPDRTPAIADDLFGLDALARVMGWQGPDTWSWPSIDALCEAATRGWR